MNVPARISIVTLGVADLKQSSAFYAGLGWERCTSSSDEICWFRTVGSYLGLYPRDLLAADAAVAAGGMSGFGGFTLAINVESEAAVGVVLDEAVARGATLLKAAQRAEWGGTSGYFADPDGHPWEVAFNPFFPLDHQGRITIP